MTVSFLDSSQKNPAPIVAVNRVNLSVKENAITALVGESGSGKSVTALSICRLVQPRDLSGEILYTSRDGRRLDLLRLTPEELRGIRGKEIAYVFQDPSASLNPLVRVGRQIREAYAAHFDVTTAEAGDRVFRSVEAVKIRDAERVCLSYPHELSGGMKQRALIAMALISEPRVLIADEPTTALDAITESEIMRLLAEIQRERKLTILFITHNLPLAASMAESIVVMEKGRVVESIQKEARGFHPRENYTKKLFGAGLDNLAPKSVIPT